jgi:CubicO group peptidase (beta-lactamase class C family)
VDSLFANGSKTRWGLGYHLYPFSPAGGDTPRPSDEADDSTESEVSPAGAESQVDADADINSNANANTDTNTNINEALAAAEDEEDIRLKKVGAFGHSGIGGSVALCDPQRGLAVAVTVNHLASNRVVAKRVIGCITEVLKMGGTYDDFT